MRCIHAFGNGILNLTVDVVVSRGVAAANNIYYPSRSLHARYHRLCLHSLTRGLTSYEHAKYDVINALLTYTRFATTRNCYLVRIVVLYTMCCWSACLLLASRS